MDYDSPFYQFDPESLGWLHRKHELDEQITKEDVARLLRADPQCGADEIWQRYALLALEGGLDAKRGRPAVNIWAPKYLIAEIAIEDRSKEIAAERRKRRTGERGLLLPQEQAANEVGEWLGIQRGRSLLNILTQRRSASKKPRKIRKAIRPKA